MNGIIKVKLIFILLVQDVDGKLVLELKKKERFSDFPKKEKMKPKKPLWQKLIDKEVPKAINRRLKENKLAAKKIK